MCSVHILRNTVEKRARAYYLKWLHWHIFTVEHCQASAVLNAHVLLSFSLDAQWKCYKCCNFSGGVALIVWFTTNGIWVKNNTMIYVARASNSKRDCEDDLYGCLLPRCEALRTCRSGFPIATKWCCDQDVEVVPSSGLHTKNVRSVWFVVKRRGCCCNLSGGVALIVWFTTNGMCVNNNTIHICGANKQL